MLIALSGGSDSTALLHLLLAVRSERGLTLAAAHFDHALEPGSRAVADRVAATCLEAGIPCTVGRAGELTGGQAGYRRARYAFLRDTARETGAERIALAHQRDDHRETVLLNLLRGTGLRGLAGIPARRGPYVRPLLGFGREELRAYLSARGRGWVTDPANLDPTYLRSRVRHRLLPALTQAVGSSPGPLLSAIASEARRADAGLEQRAAKLLDGARPEAGPGIRKRAGHEQEAGGAQIARCTLLGYDRADRARILRKIARDMGFRLGRRGTETGVAFMSEGSSGHGIDIAGGLRISREYGRFRIHRSAVAAADRELDIVAAGAGRGRLRLGGVDYGVLWGSKAAMRTGQGWTASLPFELLRFPLRLRGPRPGDRIRLSTGSRKLKKLFNERRVPASERPGVPVLVGDDDRVLWVAGHALVAECRADARQEWFTIGVVEH